MKRVIVKNESRGKIVILCIIDFSNVNQKQVHQVKSKSLEFKAVDNFEHGRQNWTLMFYESAYINIMHTCVNI